MTSDFNFTPPTEAKPVQNAYSSFNRMDSPTSTLQEIRSEAPSYYSRVYMQQQQQQQQHYDRFQGTCIEQNYKT